MIEKIRNLICGKTKIKTLENEIESLKEKLASKQDVINETNAYWKKKMYAAKKETKPKNKS